MTNPPQPNPELFEEFKEWLFLQGRSDGTATVYLSSLRNIPEDMETYFSNQSLANRKGKIAAYRSYLKFLKKKKLMNRSDLFDALDTFKDKTIRGKENNIKRVSIPKSKWRETTRLAPNQVTKMGIFLGFRFGLRRSEITHLRIEDIDFSNQEIVIREHKERKGQDVWFPKYNKHRTLFFSEDHSKVLKKWVEEVRPKNLTHPYLLWTPNGPRKGQPVLEETFYYWVKKTGIKPHDLRYSFAIHWYDLTKDVKLVSDLLGHENVATTSLYLQLGKAETKEKARKWLDKA